MRYFCGIFFVNRLNANCILACLLLLLFISAFAASSIAQTPIRSVTGTVTKVSDGDTITVHTPEKTKLKVRLYGIDAPETDKSNKKTGRTSKSGQPYGNQSQSYLSTVILHKTITLDIMDVDRYRRMVAIVWLGDRNVNLSMIKAGLAEAYVEYLGTEPYKTQFIQAEREAKEERLGIWSQSNYERPKDYKKRSHIH